jgi:hypothetical protein
MTVVTGYQFENASGTNSYEPFAALCVDQKLVVQVYKDAGGNERVAGPCPDGERHPVAEVTWESKTFFLLGWLCVIANTVWQVALASKQPSQP